MQYHCVCIDIVLIKEDGRAVGTPLRHRRFTIIDHPDVPHALAYILFNLTSTFLLFISDLSLEYQYRTSNKKT